MFQGFTEPIPISSSGHLVFAQHFLGVTIDGLSFELFVNAASLLAVLLIYREDLARLTVNGVKYITTKDPNAKNDFQFIVYLIIATIPAGVIGVLFDDVISQYKYIQVTAVTLIITGIALWTIRNLRGRKNDGDLSFKDALIIGFAQAVALIPGISRSGATIVAAMGLGMKQETALKFSFLMFIPVSFGGLILSVSELMEDPNLDTLLLPYIVAFIAALITSYFSLKWFMNIMARGNLKYFAYYCFIVGIAVLIFA
ncbi:undecaprenyl-diphosphate phosphatase [Metabacillus sp. HB246100]|uniref:undecaprenyl-diphosphate phosphatase n=1 Tax=Bacillus weihaiensis TaxID=1547283 RepID=UPI002356D43D|nr:undecaprenyl-diphosphate phosphatase [Bacillus weihaiensis]